MQMDEALAGAAYHLQHVRNFYPSNQQEFVWELEAFLVKLRSIPELALEDANETFCVGIPIDQWLDAIIFEDWATKQHNRAALQFIRSYKVSTNALWADPNVSVAFEKRRRALHRRSPRPDRAEVSVHQAITVTVSVTVARYDAQGRLVQTSASPSEPESQGHEEPDEINWYFSDYPSIDVMSLCNQVYDAVRLYVNGLKLALGSTCPSP